MGKGFKHGASGALKSENPFNFEVVAYPNEVELNVATPAENTIGIVTTNPIKGWHFSATQPENLAEGAVWFNVSKSSHVEFNALKENTIKVYPISAKQWVSGALVDVKCKTYKGDAWVEWWNGELYINGNQYEAATGGWWSNPELYYQSSGTYPNTPIDLNACLGDHISLEAPSSKSVNVTTKKKIDLTKYNELKYDVIDGTSSNAENIVFVHLLESGNIRNDNVAASGNGVIDISSISGEHYITVATVNSRKAYVGNLRLE